MIGWIALDDWWWLWMRGTGSGGPSYSLGGVVTGLDAPGLVLSNGTATVSLAATATTFTFPSALPSGTAYSVTVQAQPTGQTCSVSMGAGSISTAVTNVQVSCHPQEYAYVVGVAGLGGGVRGFAIDFTTGVLSELGNSPFNLSEGRMVNDPLGRFLVVLEGPGAADPATHRIDPKTGVVSTTAGSTYSVGGQANSAVVDPTGRFLYVSALNQSVYGFAIDETNGVLTQVPSSPFPAGLVPRGVTVDSAGKYAYVLNETTSKTTISAYSIDQTTGSLSAIPGSPFDTGFSFTGGGSGQEACDILANPHGHFVHVYNSTSQSAGVTTFAIDVATGALSGPLQTDTSTVVNPSSVCGRLSIHPSGGYLYAAQPSGQGYVWTFAVDLTTGTFLSRNADLLQHILQNGSSTLLEQTWPQSIAVDPSGQFLYIAGNNRLARFKLDPATGRAPFHGDAISGLSPGFGIAVIHPKP